MTTNRIIALIPAEPTPELLEAYRTNFDRSPDDEDARSPQGRGLAAVLDVLRKDTGAFVEQLHQMTLGAQLGAVLHHSDEARKIHRHYATILAQLLADAGLAGAPDPSRNPEGAARLVTGQLVHMRGIPVEVTGVAITHPGNWPLIDEPLSTEVSAV